MNEVEIEVTIANITIPVPMYRDEETTHAIAREINQAFEQLYKKRGRFDTPVLALQTAFAYAAMARQKEAELDETEGELVEALDGVLEKLHELTLKGGAKTTPKKPHLRPLD